MNNTPSPKFQVGEEVILLSHYEPHFNGDRVIMDMWYMDFSEDGEEEDLVWGYELVGLEGYWRENTLRKKYQPSTESFTELMNSIKIGITNNLLETIDDLS